MTRRNHDLPKTQRELDALVEWANEVTGRNFNMTAAAHRYAGVITLWETVRSWNGMGSDVDDYEVAWGNADYVFMVLCQRLQQEVGR